MDYLIKALVLNNEARVYLLTNKDTVNTAIIKHDLWPGATSVLGKVLSLGELMGSMLKGDEALTIKINGGGALGNIIVDGNAKGEVRGYVDKPHVSIVNNKGGMNDYYAIGTSGMIDVIKDLNKGEDSIDDLINLFKSTKINYSLLCRSNYIKCYKYSIDIEEKYYGFLETLLQFDILKFSSFNIANCDELINKENKKIEIGAFISRALDNNVPFDNLNKEKFSLEISSYLITELPKQYLSVIKDNIDTSIFNDVSNLKVIDIDKIKLFENDINLSKDVLVNMLDDNPQELKLILNECNAITIDKSNHSFDKERLEIAKKFKLNTIYGLFR